MTHEPKGPQAARLRQRKFHLLKTLVIPPEALPGTLSLSSRRCGKSNCHCADGEGHPLWQLTYMLNGKKRVEHIPADWAEEIQRRVDAGRAVKEALAEILNSNAELLVLGRKQRPTRKS